MPRQVSFGGKTHTFPDDATDDEIRAALEASTAAPAEPAGPASLDPNKEWAAPGSASATVGAAWDAAVPSYDTIAEAAKTAAFPLEGLVTNEGGKLGVGEPQVSKFWRTVIGGAIKSHLDQGKKAADSFKAGRAEGRGGLPPMAAVHAAGAAVPLAGPPIADLIQSIVDQGLTPANVGTGAGLVAPLVLPKAIPNLRGTPARLERAAALKNLPNMMKVAESNTPFIQENVRDIVKGLGVGNEDTLAMRARGLSLDKAKVDPNSLLGRATSRLDKAKTAGADIPIDVTSGVANLKASRPVVERGPVAVKDSAEAVNQILHDAITARADELDKLALSYGTPEIPAQPAGSRMGPQGFRAYAATPAIPAAPGPVPARALYQMREQAGKLGKKGGAFKEGVYDAPAAGAESYGNLSSEVSTLLKNNIPGLADTIANGKVVKRGADSEYALWKNVGDMLLKTEQSGASKPKINTSTILAGRLPLRLAAGSTAGGAAAMAGAPVALTALASIGGYGAFKMAQDVLQSKYWNSLRASQRIALADALRGGLIPRTKANATAAGLGATAIDRAMQEDTQ